MTSPTSTDQPDATATDTMPIPAVLRRLLDRTARIGESPDDDAVRPVLVAVLAELAPAVEPEEPEVQRSVRDIADAVAFRRR